MMTWTLVCLTIGAPPSAMGVARLEEQIAGRGFDEDRNARAVYVADATYATAAAIVRITTNSTKSVELRFADVSRRCLEAKCDAEAEQWCANVVAKHSTWDKPTLPDLILPVPNSESAVVTVLTEMLASVRALRDATAAQNSHVCEVLFRSPSESAAVVLWSNADPTSVLMRGTCRFAGDTRLFTIVCQRSRRDALRGFLRTFPVAQVPSAQVPSGQGSSGQATSGAAASVPTLLCFGERGVVVRQFAPETLNVRLSGDFAPLQSRLGGVASAQLTGYQQVDLVRFQAARQRPEWQRLDDVKQAAEEELVASIACRDDSLMNGFSAVVWLFKP